jgi:CDP-paratose 2-epimerase
MAEGEVYNMAGSKEHSGSILEAFRLVERLTGRSQRASYLAENRRGDHVCYYSDLRKMKAHYPAWNVSIGPEQILREIVEAWRQKGLA